MKLIILIIIDISKQDQNGTTIFHILDNTTELWMTKYRFGEIFSSGGATLYKNPSDQTVYCCLMEQVQKSDSNDTNIYRNNTFYRGPMVIKLEDY